MAPEEGVLFLCAAVVGAGAALLVAALAMMAASVISAVVGAIRQEIRYSRSQKAVRAVRRAQEASDARLAVYFPSARVGGQGGRDA